MTSLIDQPWSCADNVSMYEMSLFHVNCFCPLCQDNVDLDAELSSDHRYHCMVYMYIKFVLFNDAFKAH